MTIKKNYSPLVILWLSCFTIPIFSQVQINAGYNSITAESLNPESNQSLEFDLTGYSIELAYWFRLKDYRVEFYPGLGISSLNADIGNNVSSYKLELGHIFFSTRVYPFTFEDDCLCPTFKKQSGFFRDGFFLSLTPHYLLSNNRFTIGEENEQVKSHTYMFDFGTGIDIGISEFFTLTPELRYRFSGSFSTAALEPSSSATYWKTSFNGWYMGLGLAIRWKN